MKPLTIPDLIVIVPMSTELRTKLQAEYDTYDEGKKFEITRILWNGFDELYNSIKEMKTERIMQEITTGKRKAEENMAQIIKQEVMAEIEKRKMQRPEDEAALGSVRDKLQQLMGTQTN